MVIKALLTKFADVPDEIENALRQMTGSIALEFLLEHVTQNDTMDDSPTY